MLVIKKWHARNQKNEGNTLAAMLDILDVSTSSEKTIKKVGD